jgi:cell division protein FtsB
VLKILLPIPSTSLLVNHNTTDTDKMERNQKKHTIQHGEGTTSTPTDDYMNDNKTLDAEQHNVVIAGITHKINQLAAPDKGDSDNHQSHASLAPPENADEEIETPGVLQDDTIHTNSLKDITEHASTPVDLPDSAPNDTPAPSLENLLKDAHSLGAMLKHTYKTTKSSEMRQIIACLVSLDVAITRQTQLNEVHEQHTGKNFRELRHINKDRKMLVQETVKSLTTKLSRVEGQQMANDIMIKQSEIRTNGNALQIKRLNDRSQMLAEGGEWVETEVTELKKDFEGLHEEVEILKLENKGLRDYVEGLKKEVGAIRSWEQEVRAQKEENENLKEQVTGLEEEVHKLKERDDLWEKRLAILEQLHKGTKGDQ